MQTRIIYGKLKSGKWAAYEQAYRDVMKKPAAFPVCALGGWHAMSTIRTLVR